MKLAISCVFLLSSKVFLKTHSRNLESNFSLFNIHHISTVVTTSGVVPVSSDHFPE
ncbi:MAG: hypothetical protein Q8S84_03715 [bacterium]|nr:hypothetical protein [bacterium]MDP3380628.1 hypothetical protein [bacterium]